MIIAIEKAYSLCNASINTLTRRFWWCRSDRTVIRGPSTWQAEDPSNPHEIQLIYRRRRRRQCRRRRRRHRRRCRRCVRFARTLHMCDVRYFKNTTVRQCWTDCSSSTELTVWLPMSVCRRSSRLTSLLTILISNTTNVLAHTHTHVFHVELQVTWNSTKTHRLEPRMKR